MDTHQKSCLAVKRRCVAPRALCSGQAALLSRGRCVAAGVDRGFSLIESMVVTSIIALTAMGVMGSLRGSHSHAQLNEGQASVIRAFELARSRAASGSGSEDHGVHIEDDTLTIFEGPGYVAGMGEVIMLPASVTTDQASTTIVFKRLSAQASGNADVEVSHTSGETSNVTVTEDGAIIPN